VYLAEQSRRTTCDAWLSKRQYVFFRHTTILTPDKSTTLSNPTNHRHTLDPNLPYFRVHGSDNGWSFANLPVLRDAADLYSLQLEASYYSWFAKTGDPNAPLAYLKARGYDTVIEGQKASGPWNPVYGKNGPTKLLDWPSVTTGFVDVPQCAFLVSATFLRGVSGNMLTWLAQNYSLSYYLDGGI
jgi:hypothetical protein